MKLAIYGAGGMGRVLLRIAAKVNTGEARWDEVLFVDDVTDATELAGCRVMPYSRAAETLGPEQLEFVISLGEPAHRLTLFNKVKAGGYRLANLVDAANADVNHFGEGVVLGFNVTAACDVHFADNVMVLAGVSLGHDTVVGAHSVLCANAALGGCVTLGAGCFVGMGAAIGDHLTIGDGAIVSMGSAVFKSIGPGAKVLGNPAKPLPVGNSPKIFR